jgi:hypothetical protein
VNLRNESSFARAWWVFVRSLHSMSRKGLELPELSSMSKGEVGDKLDRFTTAKGIKMEYSDAILVHERAHEMLHKAERGTRTTKGVRETEAEALVFVVCHALQLETRTGSSDYIIQLRSPTYLHLQSLRSVLMGSPVFLPQPR